MELCSPYHGLKVTGDIVEVPAPLIGQLDAPSDRPQWGAPMMTYHNTCISLLSDYLITRRG